MVQNDVEALKLYPPGFDGPQGAPIAEPEDGGETAAKTAHQHKIAQFHARSGEGNTVRLALSPRGPRNAGERARIGPGSRSAVQREASLEHRASQTPFPFPVEGQSAPIREQAAPPPGFLYSHWPWHLPPELRPSCLKT